LLQALRERQEASLSFRIVCCERRQHADAPNAFALLRARRERPRRRCTAKKGDALATFHVEHGDFLPYAPSAPLTGLYARFSDTSACHSAAG
jgi:hypothetical protein